MDIATGPFTIIPATDVPVTVTLPYAWMPMETAPQDRPIIVRDRYAGAIEVYWYFDRWIFRGLDDFRVRATGWINLPEHDL